MNFMTKFSSAIYLYSHSVCPWCFRRHNVIVVAYFTRGKKKQDQDRLDRATNQKEVGHRLARKMRAGKQDPCSQCAESPLLAMML